MRSTATRSAGTFGPTASEREIGVPEAMKQNLYVLRGGAYYSPAIRCRSAQRNYCDGHQLQQYYGLRIVMEEDHR